MQAVGHSPVYQAAVDIVDKHLTEHEHACRLWKLWPKVHPNVFGHVDSQPINEIIGLFKVTIIDPIIGSIIFTIMSFLEPIFD